MTISRPRLWKSGFTLIELLVVIMIIALMLSFAMPAFSSAFTKANRIKSLANIRSIGTMFAAYSSDYRDYHPYFTDPNADYTILRSDIIDLPVRYFDATLYWNFPLASGGYTNSILNESFAAPSRPLTILPDYRYAACFLTSPDFWNSKTRQGPAQWRATRQTSVRYPSSKGLLRRLLFEQVDFNQIKGNQLDVAYSDGHAAQTTREQSTPGYPQGEGNWIGSTRITGWVIHHTRDGIFGRDN